MSQLNIVKVATRFAVLLFCLATVWPSAAARAQGGESIDELKQKATEANKPNKVHRSVAAAGKDRGCRTRQRADAFLSRIRFDRAGNQHQRRRGPQGLAHSSAQCVHQSKKSGC